ncbi:MAG: hypothetical protein Q9179_002563 [Wetmoreana sp. 5 TL-2023]
MAPKKKTKKGASNPARGFATTSVASKSKNVVEDLTESTTPSPAPDIDNRLQKENDGHLSGEQDLHELAPEELEKRLEESDLDLFLEKHGEKMRRDVARQVTKLQTEKRLLRPQTEPLQIRPWLPPEIMATITESLETKQSLPNRALRSSNPSLVGSSGPRSSTPLSRGGANGHGMALSAGDETANTDSDTESDIDPETMTEKYITLQTQLYDLQPDHNTARRPRLVDCKPGSHTDPPKDLRPHVARLLRRLERLKADILFDQYEAEQKWNEKRNQLVKAAADRRRLQLDEIARLEATPPAEHEDVVAAASRTEKSSNDSEEGDGIEAFSDFFSGLPDISSNGENGVPNPNTEDITPRRTTIRDFGKWNGVNPRRTFEEACKARDSSVQVIYQLSDRSPFSKQQTVTIHWSCDQPQPLVSPTEAVSCVANKRFVKIEMQTIATPDAAQSEAYVSTTALFLMFSSTPKEEKASLRLPSVWRDLWSELSALKKGNDMAADRDELRDIRALINSIQEKRQDDTNEPEAAILSSTPPRSKLHLERDSLQKPPEPSEQLRALWSSKSVTPSFRNMKQQRSTLPIWGFKHNILETINQHQVVIVRGETGCGKSTQVPSFILEQELSLGKACKIYCTEPRRISAISLARRVSEELGERKNDLGTSQSLVGYAIRLESRVSSGTRLVYATTGIMMRMLEASDDLGEITHLVLDEVHERSIESDFLLIVLRKLLARRPTLKVVLMSATIDTAQFSSYFAGAPILTIPGRTFPVEARFLEDALEETNFSNRDFYPGAPSIDDVDEDEDYSNNKGKGEYTSLEKYSLKTRNTLAEYDEYRVNYDLIVSLLEMIASNPKYVGYSKAILVFLPGIAEIRRLNEMLAGHGTFSYGWSVHALHSTIAMDEQERAFAIPPPGHRKVVLSTNIAETGVTIPDVTCVIDTGKHKEMRFDEKRQLSRLIEVFISRANAKQRRGRAGRVQEGICFHLFTKARHDNIMAPEQTPEMLRLSLQDLVLRVKLCKFGSTEQTLSEALDPPLAKNIRRAIDALIDVKALTVAEELTPLGDSDLLTVYNAYCAWRRVCSTSGASEQQFCRKNFLIQQNLSNIEELKAQLTTSLVDAGFLELGDGERLPISMLRSWSSKRTFVDLPAKYNRNSKDLILTSTIAWSFYPKLLKREGKGWRNVANNQSVRLYATSVNRDVEHPPKWLSFYHIMQSSNKYALGLQF